MWQLVCSRATLKKSRTGMAMKKDSSDASELDGSGMHTIHFTSVTAMEFVLGA
jgi:hypothetical protein